MDGRDHRLPERLARGPANLDLLKTVVARVCATEELVRAAFIFGSQASGKATDRSDIDVGIWLLHWPESRDRLNLWDRVASGICDALGRDDVDVVLLNSANPLLRINATENGLVAYERTPGDAARVDCIAWKEWIDQRHLWQPASTES